MQYFGGVFAKIVHAEIHDTQYAHKKMKEISLQNLANIIIFVIILLSSRERTFARSKKWHWVSCGMHVRKNLLLKFAKYYHFVIIVINKIQQENAPIWCLFLSFFWRQKITFFVALKHVSIMLSFFITNLVKYFCYFFISLCTKVKKILEKWTRKYVQKS